MEKGDFSTWACPSMPSYDLQRRGTARGVRGKAKQRDKRLMGFEIYGIFFTCMFCFFWGMRVGDEEGESGRGWVERKKGEKGIGLGI